MTEGTWPGFVGPSDFPGKPEIVREAVGKTIRRIEFGATGHPLGDPEDVHKSEALVLHFTDGTALLIEPGSNILTLADKLEDAGINPSAISTDLIPHWL